ncbi:MAG: phenylacetate--CoA ligase family protein [Schlesneria sp.]|nr:phenylacetate--CoA ligase family protein [Schlesneria sp.]
MPYHTITFYAYAARAFMRDRLNSRSFIDAYRQSSLKSLLRHARRHNPFQRERLTQIDLDNIRLEDIPPTTKLAMMERFNETISKGAVTLDQVVATDAGPHRLELPILHGKYIVHKSSGTMGNPSWMITGIRDWAILRGSTVGRMMRDWLTLQRAATTLFNPVRTAALAAEHSHSMTWQASKSGELWAGPFTKMKFFSVVDSVERIAVGLNKYRPEYLHAYPTAAEMLARYRLEGGQIDFEPGLMSVGSEALTQMARETILKAFPKTILVDHYGMTECLPLSTQCQHGHKHLNNDYSILEPMDASGQPTRPGELSDHVLVTNLINKVQPIIRYRVEDSVRVIDEPCPCGSVLPRVEVSSRKGSRIYLRNDRSDWQLLSPPVVVDTMLRSRGVAQFQLIHAVQNELELKFIPKKGETCEAVAASITDQFISALTRLDCSKSVKLKVVPVDVFQRTEGGGKLIQMVSLVPPPPATLRSAA